MQSIHNNVNQTISFVDSRFPIGGATICNFEHIASKYIETTATTVNFDATGWRNGLYTCILTDMGTSKEITSFIVKVIDIKSLTLIVNDNENILGYAKN